MSEIPVILRGRRFSRFLDARTWCAHAPCVYIQADREQRPIRVGKATKGLDARYHGGTGYALDAAMHESGNYFFVTEVSAELCAAVECELIWQARDALHYNIQGKASQPGTNMSLVHEGEVPHFQG